MTVGWQPTMVKYCMMHTLHLGICHWVNGGALLSLIHHNFFGSSTAPKKAFNPPQSWLQSSHIGIQGTQSMAEIMHLLNRRFLDWCRLHGINPGQTYIGTAHLHQEDWAELRLKAYGSRVFTAFMAVCLQVVQREHGHADLDLNLITVATQQLSTWMLDVEVYPLDLTDAQSEHICHRVSVTWLFIEVIHVHINTLVDNNWVCVMSSRFLQTYRLLAQRHVQLSSRRYPMKPKLHATRQKWSWQQSMTWWMWIVC